MGTYENLFGIEINTALIISVIGALLFYLKQVIPSFRLLRSFHYGRPEGNWWRIITRISRIFSKSPRKLFRQNTLFKQVRMETEFECLHPRPKRDAYRSNKDFNDETEKWRDNFATAIRDEQVTLDHPGKVNDCFEELERFFRAIKSLKLKGNELRFALKVHIKDGFIAPLHLVAGMLSRYDEDWVKIIDTYESDRKNCTLNPVDDNTLTTLKKIREIQKFIFDCWLQWGPSIPLCSSQCTNFAGHRTSLQYGYGDEAQSIELVSTRNHLHTIWNKFKLTDNTLAKRADVSGHITSSRFLKDLDLDSDVGPAFTTSWRLDENESENNRLLILLSEVDIRPTGSTEKQVATEIRETEIGHVNFHNSGASYYSAYLWVIFVILRQINPDNLTPIWVPANNYDPKNNRLSQGHDWTESKEPWLDLIPFFEHGNIADPETFLFMKQQLAEKAIAGLRKMVEGWKNSNKSDAAYPLRFAFACSLDHSGCGCDPDFPDDTTDQANTLKALLEKNAKEDNVLKDIILFDQYKALHPHSSCTLPQIVNNYFKHVDDVQKSKRKKSHTENEANILAR